MSHIVIERAHDLALDEARQAAEHLVQKLTERFQISYYWEGDSLYFERSGINGQIDLEPGLVRINARLGFLLAAFKYPLEQEIHRTLDGIFQPPSDSLEGSDPP